MKNRKILSLLLALVIVFSSVGNALAATFDLYHKLQNENDSEFRDFARNPDVFKKIARDLDNYLQKHADGKYYSFKEIDEEMKKGAPNASEAIKNLEPYIEIKDSHGATEIDTALNNNQAELDESKYTPESWEKYMSARNELEAIKNQRFEKESIVNEKIAKLTELKEDLVLLPTVDLSELRTLVEEGENVDLSSYTPESSAAYLGAVGEGRNILNNHINTTEEEVAATVSKIREKKALLETNYALEVQSIIKPATITVKVGEEVTLPTSVVAVMTDNSHKEVEVTWHESITSEEVGTYEIQGTAEALQTSQKILVVTEEDFVDKTHLVDAIRRGQALSESKYTPVSYRDLREALENGNQVNDNINATAEEVAAATDRITNAIIALVEQTESDRIVFVENPVKITVNLNEEVVMPERVSVVLNSGIKIEKPVIWIPSIIDTSTPGIKTAEGRVEETNQRSTLTVEVKETTPTVDKSELQNAITRGEEVNRDLYTPVSLAKMDQALSWAKKVNQMEDTTQGTVNSAKDRLNTAIDELETKPEIPEITNLKPEADQNVKAGDQVTISFNAPAGGSAGYRIVLPGSVNNSVNTPNMEEKTPGYYEAIWEVPQGFNGRGMLVFISYTDAQGTNAFATAEGKINVTQKLIVTYKLESSETTEEVSRGEKPVNTPTESDKEGYVIESWKMDGKTVNPKEIIIHENKTFEAVYNKDETQWIKVDFKLPEGVAFEDGAKTEFEILKSKSPAEQEVSIPAHKEDTVPVGKKLLWDIDLNTTLNSNTTFTAELVKDEGQFKTITVVPGENGKLNSPEVDTFEVLKTASDEEVITQAKELVKANDNYIIDEATLTENTVNISFKKDENKWVNVIFKNGESVIAQHNAAIGQSYKDAGITLPEITDIPVGQKVEWTPTFDEDNNIIKPLEGNDIVYTANFVEDETQYTTIIISTWANGSLVDDSQNSLKVLKTATWKNIKAQAEALVQADENYILDKFILGETEVQDDSTIVENGNYQAKFIKDADKWIDITFKKGEHGKLKLKAETQDSDIVINVAKGTSIEQVISMEDIEVVSDTGYLFDKWDPEVTTIDGTSTEFTAQYKKDPAGWVTVKFEIGENGSFEEGEVADQEVLKGTEWKKIVVPTPKANEGYVFDKWTPALPTDPTNQINDSVTYVANFRAVNNLSYDIKLVQVDEAGNVILDGHGKPVEIKDTLTVDKQVYGTTVTVSAPTLQNFDLISESQVNLTIKLENSENIAIFKYKAKAQALEKAKDEMAEQAKDGVEKVTSNNENISFSFDKENRIIHFNFKNPEGNALDDLYAALGGSGIFNAIANVKDMQSVSFAGSKINFYKPDGTKKAAEDIKAEMMENVPGILKAFGFEDLAEAAQKPITAQWHGVNAKPLTEGQSQGEEKVWFNDTYTFMFRVTDRDVVFDGDGKGTFDGEANKTVVKPFKEALGETPVFVANTGYILDKYSVSYKDIENNAWVDKTEEVLPEALSTFIVQHSMKVKPVVKVDESQTLSYTVKYFVDEIEKTELAEGKTVTVANPKVTLVEDKIPENYKLDTESSTVVSEENPFTVSDTNNVIERYYVKDQSKFRTIAVVAGENGSLKNEDNSTFEVLNTATEDEIKAQAKELVQADENYVIDEVTLDENTATVNFKKDPEKWVKISFSTATGKVFYNSSLLPNKEIEIVKGTSLGDNVLTYNTGRLADTFVRFQLPNGNELLSETIFNEDTDISIIASRKFKLRLMDRESQLDIYPKDTETFNIEFKVGETPQLTKEEVEEMITPFKVNTNDENYTLTIPSRTTNEKFATIDVQAKSLTSVLTLDLGENGILPEGTDNPLTVNIGSTWESVLPSPVPNQGWKFVEWQGKGEDETVIKETYSLRAVYEKDESQYKTITVVAGENGSLKNEDNSTFEVLNTATEDEIKAQAKELVQADENYVIDEVTLDGNTATVSFKRNPDLVEVTFNASKWQNEESTKIYITKGETLAGKLPTVTSKNNPDSFIGWYIGNDKVEESLTVNEDISLNAKFERKYQIKLVGRTGQDVATLKDEKYKVELPESNEVKVSKETILEYLSYKYKETSFNYFGHEFTNPDYIEVSVSSTGDYAYVQFYADNNDKVKLTFAAGENGKVEGEIQVVKEVYAGHSLAKQEISIPQPTANDGYKLGEPVWNPNITEESVFNEDTTFNANILYDDNQILSYTVKYFIDGAEKTDWQENKDVHITNNIVNEVTDHAPAGYKVDITQSTPLPYAVSAENNEIKIYYIPGDINISFQVEGENGTLSHTNTIEIQKGSTWGSIKSQFPTATPAEGYEAVWTPELPTEDSYQFDRDINYKVSFEKPDYIIGDEKVDNKNIVNREYTNNSVKNDPVGTIAIQRNGVDVTDKFDDIKFYTEKNGTEITSFDLTNGGQTFSAYVIANSNTLSTVEGEVFFKYGSVTIGRDSTNYLTIEDALSQASSGDQIIVKYNTSFANSDVASKLYGGTNRVVPSGITVLLPFDSTYSDNLEDKSSPSNGAPIGNNLAFVEMTLPDNITLDVKGTFTLNAKTSGGTSYGSGTVYTKFYSILKTGENSKINIKSGGKLNSLGFIIGKGKIEAETGSELLDLLMMHDFRGGRRTLSIYTEIFPLDQFSMNNIEVPLRIHAGSNYSARTHIIGTGFNVTPKVTVIGGEDSLLNLTSGYIDKIYNLSNGKMKIAINGDVELNNISINVSSFASATTSGKDVPFCGLFDIDLKSGSTLTTNARIKMLPGSRLNIEEGAIMNITNGSQMFVYNGENYTFVKVNQDIWNHYLVSHTPRKYRVKPTFGFDHTTLPQVLVNGTLNVSGSIGGQVTKGVNGQINFLDGSSQSASIKHLVMEGSLPTISLDYSEVNQ